MRIHIESKKGWFAQLKDYLCSLWDNVKTRYKYTEHLSHAPWDEMSLSIRIIVRRDRDESGDLYFPPQKILWIWKRSIEFCQQTKLFDIQSVVWIGYTDRVKELLILKYLISIRRGHWMKVILTKDFVGGILLNGFQIQ